MQTARLTATRVIPAPSAALYALLADYRDGHPSVLPPAFRDFTILAGGVGVGTRIRFKLRLAGRTRTMEAVIAEPEPGRVLRETYADGSVTSFIVDPEGPGSRLRIDTVWQSRSGLAGMVERFLIRRLLHPLYEAELDLIERWAMSAREIAP